MEKSSESIITRMLRKLYRPTQFRVLMISLDSAGKTTILYRLKLGEVVQAIPTIGFNVETILHHGVDLTLWDVGGCDQIRPLWRHYYQNTQALIFVVDSTDTDRLEDRETSQDLWNNAYSALNETLQAEELKDACVLVYANKQDIPGAIPTEEISRKLKLDSFTQHKIHIQSCSALTGDGIYSGLDWIVETLKHKSSKTNIKEQITETITKTEEPVKSDEKREQERQERLLLEWLDRKDEPDDEFLKKLENYTLDNWDHRTHLRIAFILLNRYGRREGMKLIFHRLKSFIENSSRTHRSRGTTFHETMTYFWVHMVHHAITVSSSEARKDFKTFLVMNPILSNGGLFLHYYTKSRMLHDPEARTSVLLPDKNPLPSLITDTEALAAQPLASIEKRLKPRTPLTDEDFLTQLETDTLSSWGHEPKLRAIYLLLQRNGGSHVRTDQVLESIARVEKSGTHLTLNYFWIQMMRYEMTVADRNRINNSEDQSGTFLPFSEFIQLSHCQKLRNPMLYEKYFSKGLINDESAVTLFLPDLKQLPSIVR